jgi:hypothetical protein
MLKSRITAYSDFCLRTVLPVAPEGDSQEIIVKKWKQWRISGIVQTAAKLAMNGTRPIPTFHRGH